MQTLLAVLAALAFCSCAVVLVVRSTVRAVRRRLLRLRDRAQLVARARGVGPLAEVARLRREQERSLAGARRALAAAQAVHAPVGDVRSLLARLELAARSVDSELRMLESQPDLNRVAAQLDGPRSRVEIITTSAAQLVDGLLHAAGHDSAELTLLQTACAIEADALRSLDRSRRPGASRFGATDRPEPPDAATGAAATAAAAAATAPVRRRRRVRLASRTHRAIADDSGVRHGALRSE